MSHGFYTIIGYLFCFVVGLFGVLFGINQNRVILPVIILMLTFFAYAGIRVALTSDHNFSATAFLISPRFGLLILTVIGAATAIFIQDIRSYVENSNNKIILSSLKFLVFLIPLNLIQMCFQYIQDPVITLAYQPLSNNTIILFSLMMILIEVLWPSKKPLYVIVIFVSMLTFCVAVIAFIGSTSIVAFWFVALAFFLWKSFYHTSILGKLIILLCVILGLTFIVNSPLFQMIVLTSRLQPLLEGSLDISSVTSRISILLTFFEQYSVDPIFGNFKADQYIGLEEGKYVHSIIFSLLTHTGIIGFMIVFIIATLIFLGRPKKLYSMDRLALNLGIGLLVLGSLFAFFTWPPFWFFLGFLCVKPQNILIYEQK